MPTAQEPGLSRRPLSDPLTRPSASDGESEEASWSHYSESVWFRSGTQTGV